MSIQQEHGLGQRVRRCTKVLLTLLSLVCTCILVVQAGAQTPPREGDEVWKYIASLPTEQRLAVLEREAKREASVVVYGTSAIDRANYYFEKFRKNYPDIKVEYVRLTTPQLVDKVLIEYRTKRVNSDIIVATVTWLDVLKDALAPYEITNWEDFYPEFRKGGRDLGWTAIVHEVFPSSIAWRTDRISRNEAPKTLDQVSDLKWKGRVGRTSHLEIFIDSMIQVYGEKDALEKLNKLAALENRLYSSHAALGEALGTGEIDLAWDLGAHRPIQLKAAGAPVDWVFQDPLFGGGETFSATRGAKHPYAAAFVMESVLTAENLEYLDKKDPGHLLGNRKGTFTYPVSSLPKLILERSIPENRARENNRIAEQLFLRRR